MPGEVIYRENELVNEMYFICDGVVELIKRDPMRCAALHSANGIAGPGGSYDE